MANNDKITIEVKQIAETTKKSREVFDSFSGVRNGDNKKDFAKASAQLSKMESFSQVEKMTKDNLKDYKKAFDSFIDCLYNITTSTGEIDKTLLDLYKKQKELRKTLDKEEEAYNKARSKLTIRKDGNIIPNDSKETIKNNGGVYRLTNKTDENGNQIASKQMETNYSNIQQRMAEGVKYVDKEGRPLEESPWWQEMNKQLESNKEELSEHQKKVQEVTSELNNLADVIRRTEEALESKKNGNNDDEGKTSDSLKQVSNLQAAGNNAINEQFSQYEDKANQKRQVASSDEKAPEATKTGAIMKAIKAFSLYNITLKLVKGAVNEAKRTIIELDRAITEQAMVTGKTRKEVKALVSQYSELASQTGATTKEVASIATQFLRQGKTSKEALELTEAAISAAKVAGIDAAQSVRYLTTALNGFQLKATDAMKVSDKFAAIASTSASSYEELATALSKVASQANMAGMSIDYTTALLAKGLETTREAPETIGTALKTVIARMREITDYGATLEDGMNINNVETQLKYVGIALRDNQGELRSTEDVLNDLGIMWDTLSKNQQASIAKALAGTRQQSRLIAMMTDYDRVLELQAEAQRAQGATSAQMSVYMEGLDASLNKIKQSWNSFIESLNQDSFINDLVEKFANFAEWAAEHWKFLAIALIGILGTHWAINKAEQRKQILLKDEVYQTQKAHIEKLKNKKTTLQLKKTELEVSKVKKQQYLDELKIEDSKLMQKKVAGTLTQEESSRLFFLDMEERAIQSEIEGINAQIEATSQEIKQNDTNLENLEKENKLRHDNLVQTNFLTSLLGAIPGIQAAILIGQKLLTKEKDKQNKKEKTGLIASIAKAFTSPITIAFGIAALAIAAAIGIALAVAVSSVKAQQDDTEKRAEDMKKLSNEIKNLQQKSNGISKVINQFEKLDEQVIKTSDDIQQMNTLLEQVEESLTDEQKADYAKQITNKEKIAALKKYKEENDKKVHENDIERVRLIHSKNDLTNADLREGAKGAMHDFAWEKFDEKTDLSSAQKTAVSTFMDNMVGNLGKDDLYNYIQGGENAAKDLADQLTNTYIEVADRSKKLIAEVMTSGSYGMTEQFRAYKAGIEQFSDDAARMFDSTYKSTFEFFDGKTEDWVQKIEDYGFNFNKINEFYGSFEKAQKLTDGFFESEEQYKASLDNFMDELANSETNISDMTEEAFEGLLKRSFNADDKETLKGIKKLISNSLGNSISEITTEMDSLQQKINNFYEGASSWSEKTKAEQQEFLDNYSALYGEENVGAMIEALETSNFDEMANLIKDYSEKQINDQIADINLALKVTTDQAEKDRLAALKNSLEKQKELYKGSLQFQLEIENKKLDKYKEFLQKQADEYTKSLEKRKDAYSKYFEEINETKEDEDFEKQAELLQSNISKLQGSDASSEAKRKELEKQLEELENERLNTLRERAQEKIVSNIDDEVTKVNENLEELLENERLLKEVMEKQVNKDNWASFAQQYMELFGSGKTDLQREQMLQDLSSIYGEAAPENVTYSENTTSLVINDVNFGNAFDEDTAKAIQDLVFGAITANGNA